MEREGLCNKIQEVAKAINNVLSPRCILEDLKAPVRYALERKREFGWKIAAGEVLGIPVMIAVVTGVARDNIWIGALAGGITYYVEGRSFNEYERETGSI